MLKVLTGLFLTAVFSLNVSAMIYQAKVRAPELTGGKSWLNTEKPLSPAALKGKVVLLDFWTYGCINCIHIIPELKKLEAKYADNLIVIGVHSAKFENEKETENIRKIIFATASSIRSSMTPILRYGSNTPSKRIRRRF